MKEALVDSDEGVGKGSVGPSEWATYLTNRKFVRRKLQITRIELLI